MCGRTAGCGWYKGLQTFPLLPTEGYIEEVRDGANAIRRVKERHDLAVLVAAQAPRAHPTDKVD